MSFPRFHIPGGFDAFDPWSTDDLSPPSNDHLHSVAKNDVGEVDDQEILQEHKHDIVQRSLWDQATHTRPNDLDESTHPQQDKHMQIDDLQKIKRSLEDKDKQRARGRAQGQINRDVSSLVVESNNSLKDTPIDTPVMTMNTTKAPTRGFSFESGSSAQKFHALQQHNAAVLVSSGPASPEREENIKDLHERVVVNKQGAVPQPRISLDGSHAASIQETTSREDEHTLYDRAVGPSVLVTPVAPDTESSSSVARGRQDTTALGTQDRLTINTILPRSTSPNSESYYTSSSRRGSFVPEEQPRFRSRTASMSSQSSLQCIDCKQFGLARSRCNVCKDIFCRDCWSRQLCHRRSARPGEVPHEQTDEDLYQKVDHCLYPEWDHQQRVQAHEADISTTWFGVIQHEAPAYPVFRDYGKFADLVGSARDFSRDRIPSSPWVDVTDDSLYPTVTSFVGSTGAGKSTIIKLLIDLQSDEDDKMPTPVVGEAAGIHPTSEDVHLYLAPNSTRTRIRFFADCEGLEGGERDPAGARIRFRKHKKAQTERAARGQGERERYASERDLTWANTPPKRTREFMVSNLYPRVLYTFSDVIVFVHRNIRTIENVFDLLLGWAMAAIETSSNQPVLPHAIIVFNAMDMKTPPERWDPYVATRQVLDSLLGCENNTTFKTYLDFWRSRGRQIKDFRELLEAYYESVTVIYIPTGERPNLLKEQLFKLQDLIGSASERALEKKADLRMLADTEEFESFLLGAFDHFACHLDLPFDFVQASFARSPIPNNFAGNIVKVARQIMDRWTGMRIDGRAMFDELSYLIASCIMMDAARHKIRGTARVIFPKYLEHIDDALENFCDQHWPCEFEKDDKRCIIVQMAHTAKGHQAQDGKIIGSGCWQSQFTYESYFEDFRFQVFEKLRELRELAQAQQRDMSISELQAVARVHRKQVLSIFFERVSRGSPRELTSHSVCFCCLFEAPEHSLHCGHIICTGCLKLYGNNLIGQSYSIKECPMEHETTFREPWTVTLRPPNSGIRILCLDGGGIRGIAELEVLRALETLFGQELPIRYFFDLVVGTSTGGIIALALTARNVSVSQCADEFVELAFQAFTPRKGTDLPYIGRFIEQFYHSKYQTEPLEQALIKLFDDDTYLFGGQQSATAKTDIKVAITATSSLGNPTIFTNYHRLCTDKLDYQVYRPGEPQGELKLWEIARATFAAPSYFEPYQHKASNTAYLDGGIYHNTPVVIADRERRLIWPTTQEDHPDFILSIGTVHGMRKYRATRNARRARGLVSHGQFMSKLAGKRFEQALNHESTWDNFIHNKRPGDDAGRYQRMDPVYPGDLPELDQVENLKDFQNWVRKDVRDSAKLAPLARRMIATCFYFEADPAALRPDDVFEVTGHIVCRFSNRGQESDGDEIKALSRFIRRNRHSSQHPCFKVYLGSDATIPIRKYELDDAVLDHMESYGSLRTPNYTIESRSSTAVTSITLSYMPGEEYPLSGVPRRLHEDRTIMTDRRQVMRSSNSTRWTERRSDSQRQRRKEWRPESLRRTPRLGSILQYKRDPPMLGKRREQATLPSQQNQLPEAATQSDGKRKMDTFPDLPAYQELDAAHVLVSAEALVFPVNSEHSRAELDVSRPIAELASDSHCIMHELDAVHVLNELPG